MAGDLPAGPPISDMSAQGIGTREPFPPAVAMVVMLVVVGHWKFGGAILCGAIFF